MKIDSFGDVPLAKDALHESAMDACRQRAFNPSPYDDNPAPLSHFDENAGPGSSEKAFHDLSYTAHSFYNVGPYVDYNNGCRPNGRFDQSLGCFVYRNGRTQTVQQLFDVIIDAEKALIATKPTLLPQGVFGIAAMNIDDREHRTPEKTAQLLAESRRASIRRIRTLVGTDIADANERE